MRLDVYLVENNYFDSREKAAFAIKEGAISVDGKIICKPSTVIENQFIEVIKDVNPFVSRGGFKLDHAIKFFDLDFNEKVVLDIGSSTGGFTDVALQNNASKVVCVDVGSNQLHDRIKSNEKVLFYENTNILDFSTKDIFDFLVMDVSFVSIKTIIPCLIQYLNDNNYLVVLIKPQYELGKVKIKNGIVKDKKIHQKIVDEMIMFINSLNLNVLNFTKSPIAGKMGNVEYLVLISKNKNYKSYNIKDVINN